MLTYHDSKAGCYCTTGYKGSEAEWDAWCAHLHLITQHALPPRCYFHSGIVVRALGTSEKIWWLWMHAVLFYLLCSPFVMKGFAKWWKRIDFPFLRLYGYGFVFLFLFLWFFFQWFKLSGANLEQQIRLQKCEPNVPLYEALKHEGFDRRVRNET